MTRPARLDRRIRARDLLDFGAPNRESRTATEWRWPNGGDPLIARLLTEAIGKRGYRAEAVEGRR